MKRDYQRESVRRILWEERESLLPHLFEHRGCGVYDTVVGLMLTAGWTLESYLLAVLFDLEDLLVEGTK